MAHRSLLFISMMQRPRVLKTLNCYSHYVRHMNDVSHRKSIYKTEEAKKLRIYVLDRYFLYLKAYVDALEKKFPGAMRVYRVFVDGTRDFFKDLKSFIRIVRTLNTPGNNLQNLTLNEIELYHQMPTDMRKVAPVLILSALPLANYIVFPLAYYFPRHLLCRHFWNLQQRSTFSIMILRKRLRHSKPIFKLLQLEGLKDNVVHKKWSNVLDLLESGNQPTVLQILECKDLFYDGPYHLSYLSGNHIRNLIKLHDLHSGWFKRTRLCDKAIILQAMDRAILREGGLNRLSPDTLTNACCIRGLNPTNIRHEDKIAWMKQWITISNQVDRDSLSLLLHSPILLGYSQPSNYQLLYKNKQ